MNRTNLATSIMLPLLLLSLAADPYPQHDLRNAHLRMTVFTPDAQKGFYRGSRFDWSGVVRDVKFNNVTMFGPWKTGHKPTNHDDITGPCEEFRTPLGYAEAKDGDTFLKVGVGTLVKPKEKEYSFADNYAIKFAGQWEIEHGDDNVTFRQGMLTNEGYGYKYTKVIDLLDTTAGFTISHELKNVGTKPLVTEWYNHNFYNVNADPVGPNYMLTLPFEPQAPKPKERYAELIVPNRNALHFKAALDKGSIFAELEGYGRELEHHGFTINHFPSRMVMTCTGNQPVSKYLLWGVSGCLCPEPYIAIDLKPGESKSWTLTYTFKHGPAVKTIR